MLHAMKAWGTLFLQAELVLGKHTVFATILLMIRLAVSCTTMQVMCPGKAELIKYWCWLKRSQVRECHWAEIELREISFTVNEEWP